MREPQRSEATVTRSGQTEGSVRQTVGLWVVPNPESDFIGWNYRKCRRRLEVLLKAREQLLDHRAQLCERLRALQRAGCQEAAVEVARKQLADTDPVLGEHEWQIAAVQGGMSSLERLEKQTGRLFGDYEKGPHYKSSLPWDKQIYHPGGLPGLAKKLE